MEWVEWRNNPILPNESQNGRQPPPSLPCDRDRGGKDHSLRIKHQTLASPNHSRLETSRPTKEAPYSGLILACDRDILMQIRRICSGIRNSQADIPRTE